MLHLIKKIFYPYQNGLIITIVNTIFSIVTILYCYDSTTIVRYQHNTINVHAYCDMNLFNTHMLVDFFILLEITNS